MIVAAERLADKEHVAAQRVAVLAERAEFGVHIRAKQGEAVRRAGRPRRLAAGRVGFRQRPLWRRRVQGQINIEDRLPCAFGLDGEPFAEQPPVAMMKERAS